MRKKYDYAYIISSFGLTKEFNSYCKIHKNISFNRQARAFLTHSKVDYKKNPLYELGNHEAYIQECIRIAKTPWLKED